MVTIVAVAVDRELIGTGQFLRGREIPISIYTNSRSTAPAAVTGNNINNGEV